MTTAPERARQNGLSGHQAAPAAEPQVPGRAPRAKKLSWFAREPAWPIVIFLVGWPLWWALGVGDYFPIILAFPSATLLHVHDGTIDEIAYDDVENVRLTRDFLANPDAYLRRL